MKLPKQAQPVVRNTNATEKTDSKDGGIYPSIGLVEAILIAAAIEGVRNVLSI